MRNDDVKNEIERMTRNRAKQYECWCWNCNLTRQVTINEGLTFPFVLSRMILCPDCGNKRCPKATDHRLDCTNSNDSGQEGSRYQ